MHQFLHVLAIPFSPVPVGHNTGHRVVRQVPDQLGHDLLGDGNLVPALDLPPHGTRGVQDEHDVGRPGRTSRNSFGLGRLRLCRALVLLGCLGGLGRRRGFVFSLGQFRLGISLLLHRILSSPGLKRLTGLDQDTTLQHTDLEGISRGFTLELIVNAPEVLPRSEVLGPKALRPHLRVRQLLTLGQPGVGHPGLGFGHVDEPDDKLSPGVHGKAHFLPGCKGLLGHVPLLHPGMVPEAPLARVVENDLVGFLRRKVHFAAGPVGKLDHGLALTEGEQTDTVAGERAQGLALFHRYPDDPALRHVVDFKRRLHDLCRSDPVHPGLPYRALGLFRLCRPRLFHRRVAFGHLEKSFIHLALLDGLQLHEHALFQLIGDLQGEPELVGDPGRKKALIP